MDELYQTLGINKVDCPFTSFIKWRALVEPTMGEHASSGCLCTASQSAMPSGRMVLCKSFDENGILFYTHYSSQKGVQLTENPQAELVFWWPAIKKQVRFFGSVEKISAEASQHYFETRHPRSKHITALSHQGSYIPNLQEFYSEIENKPAGDIPCPRHWGGFKLIPQKIEFFHLGENRLNIRLEYNKTPKGTWQTAWPYP